MGVSSTDRTGMIDAALLYARLGFAVLPLHYPQPDGSCSCRKPKRHKVGKHPMTPRGVYDATTDEAVMRNWRTKCPEANIGIATGARRGLLVVDIDPRNGGDESITELEQQHGALATS